MLDSASRAFLTGLAAVGLVLLLSVLSARMGQYDALLLLIRAAHVFAAMVWVGLIWFVNWIQLAVLAQADEATRKAVSGSIVPRVAIHFKTAANLTFVTGAVLLVLLGYLTSRPIAGSVWLWAGVVGGFAMLGFVHARIAPALRIVLDKSVPETPVKSAARETVRTYARVNLMLALPVTVAMLAAAHA